MARKSTADGLRGKSLKTCGCSTEPLPNLIYGPSAWIKLDIDEGTKRPKLATLQRLLRRAGYRIEWLRESRSPGGKGWHIIMQLDPEPTSPFEVVALQAILGSDVNREACNLHRARVLPGVPKWAHRMWNVLYTRKEK